MPPKKKPAAPAAGSKGPCSVCCQPLSSKDEALFCDGRCQQWLHRYCASVTVQQYKAVTDSNGSFLCPWCSHERQQEEIISLRNSVDAMRLEIAQLKESLESLTSTRAEGNAPCTHIDVQEEGSTTRRPYATVASSGCPTHQPPKLNPSPNPTKPRYVPDKKFNVILYGVNECPPGTDRLTRLSSDLNNVVAVFSTLDSDIQRHSIKECYRLGKFDPQQEKPRPILARFIQMADVVSILSKRGSLSKPHFVKPDMSLQQRKIEAILLKQRWSLLQAGTPRSQIKIRNASIFVGNKLHGKVVNNTFMPANTLVSQGSESYNAAQLNPIVTQSDHQQSATPSIASATSEGPPIVREQGPVHYSSSLAFPAGLGHSGSSIEATPEPNHDVLADSHLSGEGDNQSA